MSGFWHGANWTFIIWGLIHALLFLPLFLFNKNRDNYGSTIGEKTFFPNIRESFQVLTNFLLVTIAWVFFRSESVTASVDYLIRAMSNFTLSMQYIHPRGYRLFDYILILIIFILCEYKIRHDERSPLFFNNKYLNWITLGIICPCSQSHGTAPLVDSIARLFTMRETQISQTKGGGAGSG